MGTPFHVFVTLNPGESRLPSTHTPQPLQVRQLDVGAALAKLDATERDAAAAGVLQWAPALEQARATAARVRDSAAYKWVRLDQLCA